jgi:hypothetical protein
MRGALRLSASGLLVCIAACDAPQFTYHLKFSQTETLDVAELDGQPAAELTEEFSDYASAEGVEHSFAAQQGTELHSGTLTIGRKCANFEDGLGVDVGDFIRQNDVLFAFDSTSPPWSVVTTCVGTEGQVDDNSD